MQIDLPEERPNRNYIRRKRCLNESIQIIEKTLNCLANLRKDNLIKKEEISKLAKAHANEVEAACWAPRLKMSDDDYQNRMSTKTKELCLVLINKLLPIQNFARPKVPIPQKVPQKLPTVPQTTASQPNLPPKSETKPLPPIPVVSFKPPTKPKIEFKDIKTPEKKQPIIDPITFSDPLADFTIPDPLENFISPTEIDSGLLCQDLDYNLTFTDSINEPI